MDYIYCADADEVLDEENRARFLDLKKALLPEIEIVQMKYAGQLTYNTAYNYDVEYRPKLYKRLRSFTFDGPVHETVVTEPVVYDSDIRILHKPHGSGDFFCAVAGTGIHNDDLIHKVFQTVKTACKQRFFIFYYHT